MLRDVNSKPGFSISLASAVLATLVVFAASPACAGYPAHAAVHPTAAPSNSTRHVTHDTSTHHKRHVRAHRTEPNLHAQPVAPASQPAPIRTPAHPRLPRSSHGATAPNVTHRDGGTRRGPTRGGWGAAGLPVTGASAMSLAVLGTCVHQRTRDRLRSVSQPLESRGPPRAGPTESSVCRIVRGAHDFPPSASALNLPLGRSPDHRASHPFGPPRLSPWPAASPLARGTRAKHGSPHACPLEPPFRAMSVAQVTQA